MGSTLVWKWLGATWETGKCQRTGQNDDHAQDVHGSLCLEDVVAAMLHATNPFETVALVPPGTDPKSEAISGMFPSVYLDPSVLLSWKPLAPAPSRIYRFLAP